MAVGLAFRERKTVLGAQIAQKLHRERLTLAFGAALSGEVRFHLAEQAFLRFAVLGDDELVMAVPARGLGVAETAAARSSVTSNRVLRQTGQGIV